MRRVLNAAMLALLSPLLVAQQVMGESSGYASPQAGTGTQASAQAPNQQAPSTAAAEVQDSAGPSAVSAAAQSPATGTTKQVTSKHKRHGAKQALLWTGRVIGVVAMLPLFIPYFLVWMVIIMGGGCKDGC